MAGAPDGMGHGPYRRQPGLMEQVACRFVQRCAAVGDRLEPGECVLDWEVPPDLLWLRTGDHSVSNVTGGDDMAGQAGRRGRGCRFPGHVAGGIPARS